jgi:hypothetical protein
MLSIGIVGADGKSVVMKTRILTSLALMLCVSATAAPSNKVVGDYVEARTASVFAGPCHYNGELVTTGRDAVMAWNITDGSWKGIDLTGIRAMAAVTSQASLGDEQAARKSEVMVDSSASAAQVSAFVDFLGSQCGKQIGQIAYVRRGVVTFDHTGKAYEVKSEGFGALSVQAMPNDDCCSQPSLVWYSPLVQLEHRKVGFTSNAAYTAAGISDQWQQGGENSAFYGSFSF